jgi:dihydrofolate synthase/folylpolyglutamate synthase
MENIVTTTTIAEAINQALSASAHTDTPLIICGSFFIMSAARQAVGISDERDPWDLNEHTLLRK